MTWGLWPTAQEPLMLSAQQPKRDWSPAREAFRWSQSQVTFCLYLDFERLNRTNLSHMQIPDPEKLWNNSYCCFMSLNFGIIFYSETGTWVVLKGFGFFTEHKMLTWTNVCIAWKRWPRDNVKGVLRNYLLSTGTHGRIKGLIIQPHKGPLKDTEREPPDPLNQIGPLENVVVKVSSHLIRAR